MYILEFTFKLMEVFLNDKNTANKGMCACVQLSDQPTVDCGKKIMDSINLIISIDRYHYESVTP